MKNPEIQNLSEGANGCLGAKPSPAEASGSGDFKSPQHLAFFRIFQWK